LVHAFLGVLALLILTTFKPVTLTEDFFSNDWATARLLQLDVPEKV
jgi:hypothetical protein